MKKGLISVIMLCLFILGIGNVQAKTISWQDIKTNFIEKVNTDSIDSTAYKYEQTNDKLNIFYEDESITYDMTLNYDNNSISYTNTRDISNLSEEYRVSYALIDNLMLLSLNLTIIDLYNQSEKDLESIMNLQQKLIDNGAITIVYGDEVSYSNKDENPSVNLSSVEIKSYKINLDKVDQIINDTQNNITTPSPIDGKTESTQKIENPKTLDLSSSKYLLFIGIGVVGICGLICVSMYKTKKGK